VSWKQLLDNRDVQRHQTSKQELDNIRKLIIRDLADASITALSADRRFATAYNAALQAAAMTVLCSGYRVSARAGHHQITFEAAHLAIGSEAAALTDYFDACRRKRNVIDYINSSVATETESEELLQKAQEFHVLVEQWIATKQPNFTP
jgi:uncharacterized protein (UPF0332 family)